MSVRGVFMSHLVSYRLSHCLYFLAAPLLLVLLLAAIFRGARPAAALPDERAAAAQAFLAGCGWKADPASCERAEVVIPERFGEVYRQYNELLRRQGYDLTPYRGRRAVRFTFTLAEHPFPEEVGPVHANVLFVGDEIVAADLCSVGINGFMEAIGGRPAEP